MQIATEKLKKHLANNKLFYLIILFYFILRLVNLTAFPLFNDESIYLDWGVREINHPGYLYYSLYDAKQPLLMWAFGIMEDLLKDPVFAGRLVSVFCGFLSVVGLYKLVLYIANKSSALLSALLYTVIPLFSFYDRQALMEASIAAVGIWSCYFAVKSIYENKYSNYVLLGVILGVGYFIKSSSLIFLVSALLWITVFGFINKAKAKTLNGLVITITSFLAVIFLLIINPSFWSSFSSNSRYSLTVSEILGLPLRIWLSNASANLQISLFYITPVIFIFAVAGITLLIKHGSRKDKMVICFFLLSVGLETLASRGSIDRYVEPFLPLTAVFAGIFLITIP